jgi:hypothetical protein
MAQYEKVVSTKVDSNRRNFSQYVDEYIDEINAEHDLDAEAFDIRNYTDDYNDGNFEGDENDQEDFGTYDS